MRLGIRLRGWSPHDGISALVKEIAPSFHHEDAVNRQTAIYEPESEPHQTPDLLVP